MSADPLRPSGPPPPEGEDLVGAAQMLPLWGSCRGATEGAFQPYFLDFISG